MSESADTPIKMSARTGLPLIPKQPPGVTSRCGEAPAAALLRAIEQFNSREYWETHETLEQLWRHEPDPVRSLYQGILLIAVGLYHLSRYNYHGATVKLAAGIARLEPFTPACQCIDVAHLRQQAEHCLESLQEVGASGIAGLDLRLPQIRLLEIPADPANDTP